MEKFKSLIHQAKTAFPAVMTTIGSLLIIGYGMSYIDIVERPTNQIELQIDSVTALTLTPRNQAENHVPEIRVNIQQIHNYPEEYEGKIVVVRGKVTRINDLFKRFYEITDETGSVTILPVDGPMPEEGTVIEIRGKVKSLVNFAFWGRVGIQQVPA